jgi:peptidoglycan/xylan/chitin deacetylase (PgdA/CDA1 family)
MNVSPEQFDAQMTWLKEHTPVIRLRDAAEGQPGVALTFDDGYRDNLHHAAPVLERLGLPATVFMVAAHAGGALPHDAAGPDARLMTWDELRALRRLGVDVGSHTMTHRRLSTLPAAVQRHELAESKAILEGALGEAVTALAYPFGSALDYTSETVSLAASTGYALAVSNRYGPVGQRDAPYALRRIWVDRTDTVETFAWKVTGKLDALAALDSAAGIRARRWLNRTLLGRSP